MIWGASPDTLAPMTQPVQDDEKELLRSRRTLFLLLGGAASLLLPLGAILYLKLTDPSAGRNGPQAAVLFEKRGYDGQSASNSKITPAMTPAVNGGLPNAPAGADGKPGVSPAVPAGSSLSMVRGGEDMYEKPAPAPPPPAPKPQVQAKAPPPPPEPEPEPAPQPTARAFQPPKLKSSGNFTQFKSSWQNKQSAPSKTPQGQQAQQAAATLAAQKEQEKRYGKSASGAGSGANLPKLGAFGQQQAPAPPQGVDAANIPMGANGQPDMGALLKNLPGQPGSDRR